MLDVRRRRAVGGGRREVGRAVEIVEPEKREKREKSESRGEREEKREGARRGLSNLGIYMTNTDRFIYRSV